MLITKSNSLEGDLPLVGHATVVTVAEHVPDTSEIKEDFCDNVLLPVSSGSEVIADDGKVYAPPKRSSFALSDEEEKYMEVQPVSNRQRADTEESIEMIDSSQVFEAYANRKVRCKDLSAI